MLDAAREPRPAQRAAVLLICGLFALGLWTFSGRPLYRHLKSGEALVKLSFTHAGQRLAPCRPLDAQELAKLAPNMRAAEKCERARAPVRVEVDIDGKPAFRHAAAPSGLSGDGASSVYQRLRVSAGTHRFQVRLKDSAGAGGFEHQREATLTLQPAQVLVIDFDAAQGGITLQ